MSRESSEQRPDRIEIPGDVLILDGEFCRIVLGGATKRTAARLESQGLPLVMIAGKKYRPLQQGQKWLAARIVSRAKPRHVR